MDAALWLSPLLAPDGSLDPSSSSLPLADYGLAGLVAAIFLTGFVWVGKRLLAAKDQTLADQRADHSRELGNVCEQRDQEKQRADRLENELSKLNATTQAQLATLQTQWLAAVQESQRAVAEAIATFRRPR